MAIPDIYPLPGFHFRVTFLNITGVVDDIGFQFTEVSGLSAELAVEELMEGGENRFVHKLPSRTKFPNLVLKRGLFPVPSPLINWAQSAIYDLDIQPCSLMISLLNSDHMPVKNWSFSGVYPVKLQVSDFKSTDNSVVVETLELAYEMGHELKFM